MNAPMVDWMGAMRDYWLAGGLIMIPLAVLCLSSWLWIMTLYPRLRRASTTSLDLRQLLHDVEPERLREQVETWAASHPGPVARAAVYASKGPLEGGAVRSRLAEARLVETPRFALELNLLRAMVVAAPLLGLLGTVRGMIATFWVLASHGTASMELLSAGISEALVTTQVGLVVALPGLIGAFALGRRLADLEAGLDLLESHLVAITARHPVPSNSKTQEVLP